MKLPWYQWMDKMFQQRLKNMEKENKGHIHLIAIGGAAMHNLALSLHHNGFKVTGSDDEIYNPSRQRLADVGLLPEAVGWHADRIHSGIDFIIVGMHARADNPELQKAQELGLRIVSYPEFMYEQSKDKKRVVVGGSHGKTSTTAMILHVLNYWKKDADYLVGAQLEGFERMVRISDAPIIVIEGDEYLSSPLVREPKFHFYKPHIAILTGIAWDHINVFPTFENYVEQFSKFVSTIEDGGFLAYYTKDNELQKIATTAKETIRQQAYDAYDYRIENGETIVYNEDKEIRLKIFGDHNLQNMNAARLVCKELDLTDDQFFEAIQTFKGAAKRLELLKETKHSIAYKDFAHAPSKLKATVHALKDRFPERTLIACFELHTFSSLNKAFLPEYRNAMEAADVAYVYFSEHTLEMKRLPKISKEEVQEAFNHPNLTVFTDRDELLAAIRTHNFKNKNLLMMSSGTFDKTDLNALVETIFSMDN
jgi:UDP-N-acetylmuramate: L-alanyl-gamma-D-glutamyl-meso-diaminopimelate ligase